MDTVDHLLKLMNVELSLLICSAKFKQCTEDVDLDDACFAQKIAFDSGMQYEILESDISKDSVLICNLKNDIKELYFSLPSFLLDGFNRGRCDVQLYRAGLD